MSLPPVFPAGSYGMDKKEEEMFAQVKSKAKLLKISKLHRTVIVVVSLVYIGIWGVQGDFLQPNRIAIRIGVEKFIEQSGGLPVNKQDLINIDEITNLYLNGRGNTLTGFSCKLDGSNSSVHLVQWHRANWIFWYRFSDTIQYKLLSSK
jgi:hypothetical protein